MITGLAHTAVCVPDLEEAVAWYTSALGLQVLSPPTLARGAAIERDMGEIVPGVVLKAAILGFPESGDRVLELIEYPEHPGRVRPPDWSLADYGCSHIGLVCEDIEVTRARLEERGVEFITRGISEIAGLKTTWLRDLYGVVFILMEKTDANLPYFRQWAARG